MSRKTLHIALVLIVLAVLSAVAAAALTTKINLIFHTTLETSHDLSTSVDPMLLDRSISLTSGTGANQANILFADSRSLADDANEVLDFYASGSLLDPHGTALTIETLKVLYLYNTSTDASLLIGGGTVAVGLFSDTSDKLILKPGGKFIWVAPDATGLDITTNKDLNLTHNGDGSSNLTYEVIAIGVD